MRWPRPKSLTALLLSGFALVSVPLLLAVVIGATKVRHLSDESTILVRSGVEITHHTQQLFQQIASVERSVKLYQVLSDPGLREVYQDSRERLRVTLGSIESMTDDPLRHTQVQALRVALRRIDAAFSASSPASVESMRAAVDSIASMWEAAFALSAATGEQVESGLSRLQASTVETQQYLIWQSAGLILLTAALVTIFTLLLMRPIRQIDRAISRLGKGTFSRTIKVRGPTDLVHLGRQLEWLRLRLLELAQERNRFLRHMSHELKTPLANIREGTELLMDGAVGELDSAQREVATILRDNGIKLQQLIENLLSFSAWQTRHTGLEISEFRLRPLVKSTLETHQLALLAQRVHLDLKVQDIELRADRAKLKLILDNLLSNALKYGPRGGTIYIHAHADQEMLVLDIADTGPGVSQEERKAIFEAFYSGRAPMAGHLKGTGIGLSVVSEFVQAHGGSIEIVNGKFPGAHFCVRLPLAPQLEAEPA
ncbi:two-component system, NtrC family, sensor histidine kinase GlrK [Steroidobacter denitrificans]|uniref:histidine kinase n=1 Tax=Steroidobacter denitrificans TaxID=465721 RepID=A0A127FCY6_STEDE|nr:HAMP domain-containing sensor histidine kinase [Steroidobacter denitrificans]AMN47429.1 two-component system, NtrC family, sensor histidine kinase GlrK [Steroidobacter denitrificans]